MSIIQEPTYKEIKQVKAYDIEGFVGNAGGYVGLFLGYALLSLPKYLVQALGAIKTIMEGWLKKDNRRKDSRDSTQGYSTNMVDLNNIDKECDTDDKLRVLNNALYVVNERLADLELKCNTIERKLNNASQQTLDH